VCGQLVYSGRASGSAFGLHSLDSYSVAAADVRETHTHAVRSVRPVRLLSSFTCSCTAEEVETVNPQLHAML
jgi:hypothetical protein